jgi:hypothetical protein
MTRPIVIQSAGLFVSADVAAELGPVLMEYLERAQRDRRQMNSDTAETVEKLDVLGAWWRNKNLPYLPLDLPSVDTPCSDPVKWLSVTTAAETLERTTRAVTGLLARGSLHGEQDGRTWRVCGQSVDARLEGRKCQH